MSTEVLIGEGMGPARLSTVGPEGVVTRFRKPAEVVNLISTKKDLKGIIGLVRGGTMGFAAALLAHDIPGIITLEGAPQSHLGIIAREMGTPCIMTFTPQDESVKAMKEADYEAYLEEVSSLLEGKKVKFDLKSGEEREGWVQGLVYEIG